MNHIIRKIAIWLGIGIVVLLILSAIIASVFQDQIVSKLVTELNKQLKSELSIGSSDLSIISSFPNVSATLEDVYLEDAFEESLLEAKEVSFKLGLFSLLGSTIKLKSVIVKKGALNVHIDRKGKANYDILVESQDTTETGEVGIEINEARLKNIALVYNDDKAKHYIKTDIKNLAVEGAFSDEQFNLESSAELKSHYLKIGRTRYLPRTKVGYDAKIFVNLKTGVYDLERVEMLIGDNSFKVDGFVETLEDLTDIDLIFTSDNANLESVISMLPEQYLNDFQHFRSKGKFHFEASVNGQLGPKDLPAIDVSFGLKNGSITSPRLEHSLKDVTFSALYSNGQNRNNRTSTLEIPGFKGYFNQELIDMNLKMSNFDDPRIDFQINGVVPLASVYGLFNSPIITNGSGEIEVKDFTLNGRYKDMLSNSRVGRVNLSGQIEFDDAALVVNEEEIIVDRGSFTFKDNLLAIEDIKIDGAGSEIQLGGTFHNLLPVIFADENNSKRAELRFQAELNSPKLDIQRIVKLTGAGVEEGDVKKTVYDSLRVANTQKRERVTNLFKGNFNANIEQFTYDQIEGRDFKGKLEFDNNEMIIEGKANGMNGSFDLDGTLYFENKPYLKARLVAKEVDIKEFFRQSRNFGQEVLQSRHLRGDMNAKLAINAYWDREGNFDMDKLNVLGAIGIHDGELKNFKLLEQFSSYVKLPDLRNISFVNLENWLEVKNQTIYIPTMFVQSNALNLTINGDHTFNNDINYNLRVNAGQVIMTKLKRHDPKLSPIPAKKKGLFNLYYNIYGTVDDFDYKNARRQVKNDFRKSDHHKREIKAALLRAFGDIKVIEDSMENIPEFEEEIDPDDEEYIDWGEDS